jgi:hypothetical protein
MARADREQVRESQRRLSEDERQHARELGAGRIEHPWDRDLTASGDPGRGGYLQEAYGRRESGARRPEVIRYSPLRAGRARARNREAEARS